MDKAPLSTRGWDKMSYHSTQLSSMKLFRKCVENVRHIKDSTPCMFEFTLKFPPRKKKAGVNGG